MTMSVTLNQMKWKAELYKYETIIDDDDRMVKTNKKVRNMFYMELGITSQEKYLSKQAKIDVVRRIRVRLDKSIGETLNTIRINEINYKITRIYTDMDKREMELSLAYVD
ncbi:phage head closure protein [Melissococcus plutonius]|uniref:phage head closure protein n=1 Tax=Melissococcus plutonius TaxID=33970 RepID=UPI0021E5CF6F|nr:phage head closure protein [Melissococcus plutonius]MCV2499599.1 phage head closure protein [Melissococcus plutonius]MCV2501519.1 phage head closure protein [Melissococcus plutonius]MCV2505980.1 phage head closure protein [Melissococcus plutonius]MCV2508221.1 phage head closure protein [Melissococcus plutonius]MCV2519991.1 phage head closure protein [Melissococcus plutonius]